MRRADFLIQAVREISRTEANEDSTKPIKDNTILQYLNDALERMQGLFISMKNTQRPFLAEKTISIVANQEAYSIPDKVALNKQIHNVLFSTTGNANEWLRLRKLNIVNRDFASTNYPTGYYVANGQINLVPIPSVSTGYIKVSYDRALDRMDIRRGKISTVTGLTSTTFTSITLDSSADETSTPNLTTIDYICICNVDGAVTAYNIPVGSYDTGTNVLTPRAGFTFASGETIAVDSYVTFGKYTTTHARLIDEAERYLIHYAAKCCMAQESSSDSLIEDEGLRAIQDDILRAFSSQTGELQEWPTVNYYEW